MDIYVQTFFGAFAVMSDLKKLFQEETIEGSIADQTEISLSDDEDDFLTDEQNVIASHYASKDLGEVSKINI